MLLALVLQFGVAPRVIAYHGIRLWHNLATGLYIGQWLCAFAVLWMVTRRDESSDHAVTDR